MSNYEMIELSDEAMQAVSGGEDIKIEDFLAIAIVDQETTVVNIAGDDIDSDVTVVGVAMAKVED